MAAIATVVGREILDSRGNPTVEVDVLVLENGSWAAPQSHRARRRALMRRMNCGTGDPGMAARA